MYNMDSSYLVNASAVVCALVCLQQLHAWRKRRNHPAPFPPGPKGLPLIGNVFDMPQSEEWKTVRDWGHKYGPVVYVENLGTSMVFLNTYKAAVDLFEKRGQNYSSRPKIVMIDLEGWGWFPALMPYGEELRRARQILQRFFQPSMLDNYTELQTQSTNRMLDGLLKTPERFSELVRHSAGETILMVSFGYKAAERDDPLVALVEKGVEAFGESLGFFLVNLVPWLQYLPAWLPGMNFLKIAREGHKHSMKMYHEPHKYAKERFFDGTAVPSMSSKLLEENVREDGSVNDEALIAKVTGVAYAAGADTTADAMMTFILAMVLFPDVQRRGQEELDRVVGKNNLPTFEDRPNLPYIEGICKEALRWQIITPWSIAHTAAEDDEYNGYFIPAGATVLPNLWAMSQDPEEYPEPDQFMPERWIPIDGKEPPLDISKIAFGIGRRICPGRHFADNSLFIGVASILSTFSITKALDENGVPITPTGEYVSSSIRHPKPFKCAFTPRSEKIVPLVRQAVDSAK